MIALHGPLPLFCASADAGRPSLETFATEILDLEANLLGPEDASYDCAAVVALQKETLTGYARLLTAIVRLVPRFLMCFEYDQKQFEAPTF